MHFYKSTGSYGIFLVMLQNFPHLIQDKFKEIFKIFEIRANFLNNGSNAKHYMPTCLFFWLMNREGLWTLKLGEIYLYIEVGCLDESIKRNKYSLAAFLDIGAASDLDRLF